MQYSLESMVRRRDGEAIGELRHIVCDPETREVVSLVVQETGPDGHAVIVPIGTIDPQNSDDTGDVYTLLDENQVVNLQDLGVAVNVAGPPADTGLPGEASGPSDEGLPGVSPNEVPVGAAAGIESIAFTPIVEVFENIPESMVVLDRETAIEASDASLGKLVGVTDDEETHRLATVIAERGVIIQHEVAVDVDLITSLQHDVIRVNATRSAIEEANRE